MDAAYSIFQNNQCRLVLIGKTGNGKSATGNSILGYKGFNSQTGINSVTVEGDVRNTKYGEIEIQVLDTPGLHDTEVSDDVIAQRVTRSLMAINPGPHAIIFCLSCADRFTPAEFDVYKALKELLGETMPSYIIVVLVKRDVLERSGYDFEKQLEQSVSLKELLKECDNRYVLFDNTECLSDDKKLEQRKHLMDKVEEVIKANEGRCFANSMYREISDTVKVMAQRRCLDMGLELPPDADYATVNKPGMTKRHGTTKRETAWSPGAVTENLSLAGVAVKDEAVDEEIKAKFSITIRVKKAPAPPAPTEKVAVTDEPPRRGDLENFIKKFEAARISPTPVVRPPTPGLLGPRLAAPPKPQRSPEVRGNDVTNRANIPGPGFVFEIEDRPGMTLADKIRMVEENMKRRLAQGDLTPAEEEEVIKVSKGLLARLKSAMAKFAVKTVEKCAVM